MWLSASALWQLPLTWLFGSQSGRQTLGGAIRAAWAEAGPRASLLWCPLGAEGNIQFCFSRSQESEKVLPLKNGGLGFPMQSSCRSIRFLTHYDSRTSSNTNSSLQLLSVFCCIAIGRVAKLTKPQPLNQDHKCMGCLSVQACFKQVFQAYM